MPRSFKEEDLKKSFDEVDKDGSGFIEKNEVALVLEKMGVGRGPEMDGLMELFMSRDDKDKDGKLSWTEFKNGLLAKST